jgi:hypothetical protein
MSGDYCDIYFSIDQLNNESDAFDVIDQFKAEVDIIKLPGVLFWGSHISDTYFLSFLNLSERDIASLLLKVFQQIRTFPDIGSIAVGKELFKKDFEREKAGDVYPSQNIIINIETGIDDVNTYNFIKNIFGSLEWNDENKKLIEMLESGIKCNRVALEDVQSSINKLVEANATNNSFT